MFSSFKSAKVLAFGTHPDDIEIGCGGTLLKLADAGHTIYHAILTRGEEGSLSIPKAKLADIRKKEAQEASKLIGAQAVHFFNYEDGLTNFSKDMKIEVMAHIRKVRPDIVFIHAHGDSQPDHQIVTKLVMDAISSASGPWFPDAKGKPHTPKLVLGYEVWSPIPRPQFIVNISKYLDQKKSSILAYKSQIQDINYTHAIEGLSHYRSLLNKDNAAAEAFEIIYCQEF